MTVHFDAINPGDTLPEHHVPPISRTTLALYAGGSGDHTPYHIDIDYAREAGFDDVFAHGMLSMAYLGQLLTGWVSQEQIKSFSARFMAITEVGDQIICRGRIVDKFTDGHENCVRVALEAHTRSGKQTLSGEAVVTLP